MLDVTSRPILRGGVALMLFAACASPGLAQVVGERLPPVRLELPQVVRPACATLVAEVGEAAARGVSVTEGARGFPSIDDALRTARAEGACRIEIRLRAGRHAGPVEIDRPTEIVGAAGLERTYVTGAVRNESGAALELRGITIEGVRGVSVHQVGGSLLAEDFRVTGTETVTDDPATGVAAEIVEGAKAILRRVTLDSNAGPGLVVEGSATEVRAHLLIVRSNDNHPLARQRHQAGGSIARLAGVEVAEGALLRAELVEVDDNELHGVLVHGGGRAHLRLGLVRDTRTFSTGPWSSLGGFNVHVFDGVVELERMELRNALVGLVIAERGRASARYTRIHDHEIGIAYAAAVVEVLSRCVNGKPGVRIYDNDRRTAFMDHAAPVPDVGDPLGEAEGPPPVDCPSVPWE